jgi:hypothetical protein
VEPTELLGYAAGVLERLGIRYAVVGSFASSFFGEARFTNDVDIVADLTAQALPQFISAFPPDQFYVSEDAVRAAIGAHGQFNIIHPDSGLKIDVIIPDAIGIDDQRLERRMRVQPRDAAFEAYFAAPEDVILNKLKYYQDGQSDKHLRDIAGILKVSGDRIDRAYIEDWASRLGLMEEWLLASVRAGWR